MLDINSILPSASTDTTSLSGFANPLNLSSLDKSVFSNSLYKSLNSGILGSIQSSGPDVFSGSFLYQILDSQLMTPQVLQNYYSKIQAASAAADTTFGTSAPNTASASSGLYDDIVDQIIRKNHPDPAAKTAATTSPAKTEDTATTQAIKYDDIVNQIIKENDAYLASATGILGTQLDTVA